MFLDEAPVRRRLRWRDMPQAIERALIGFSTGNVVQPDLVYTLMQEPQYVRGTRSSSAAPFATSEPASMSNSKPFSGRRYVRTGMCRVVCFALVGIPISKSARTV
jgi:hypothetical protein